jgi:tetratricopeptide (TPR) repeat protein
MKIKKKIVIIIFILVSYMQSAFAVSFNENLREIRSEINRDNLQDAIKKLKKININSEIQQEKIDLLFGDIYLKINQIDKAEEFYQKKLFYFK